MFFKRITMVCAAASLLTIPTTQAQADSRDFAAGIVAGVVGSAIVRNAGKQKRVVRKSSTRTYKKKAPSVSPAVRAERREVQTALNYFGFPAGSPDGILGRKSRAAITSYQAHLGYPATGQLTQYEQDFLLTSYRRALAGGSLTTQQIAANPLGPKGLLNQYRNEAAGVTTANVYQQPQQNFAAPTTVVATAPQALPQVLPQVVAPQVATTQVVAPAVQAPVAAAPAVPQVLAPLAPAAAPNVVAAAAPTPAAPATAAAPALPSFMTAAEPTSLASHCSQINLVTNTNGGFTKADAMTDVEFAMNEQFCLARTYAISTGEEKAAAVQGASPQQIEAQCKGFAPILSPFVASLSAKTQTEVVAEVDNFVSSTGMTATQMADTAKICLSVGYKIDNMEMAAGSALLMVAVGQPVYGELVGHHLAQGFGVAKNAEQSMPWFELSLGAIEAGTAAVFAPGQPERTALLRKATANLNGTPAAAAEVQPVSALPTFGVTE